MTALAGFRVLELAVGVAGEYCGKLLADFGAEVIKLEHPAGGSPTRHLGPFARSGTDVRDDMRDDIRDELERSGLFAYLNTNKCSVTLDVLNAPEDSRLDKLLQNVDVVIDDHPAGWLHAAGLDPDTYQQKYPGLVVCSITAFGQHPPEDRLHAEDLNVFHASGWGYHTPGVDDPAQAPLKGVGRFLPSYEAGLEAALCIVAALYAREATALGRFIDVSKLQVLASRADYVLAQMVAGDMPVGPQRTAYNLGGPAGIFTCRDGYAYIWMSAPTHWAALRKLLDNPQWMASFPDNWLEKECTPERVAQCRHYLTQWLQTQDKHVVAAAAQKLGLTLVAVNNASDLQSCEQYQFRRFFQTVAHPVQGAALYPTVPYQLSETPARIATPAPLLGQHTQSMLAALRTDRSVTARATAAARITQQRGGPLQGVRVVELTKVWAGPYVGKLLAYLGAEVIRVESEDSLDVTRSYGVSDINNAPGFQSVNPEKLSVTVNMKTAEGVGLIRDLLKKSDIVVENLRPGAVKRLGLGYAEIRKDKPDIVYVSMGMYGTEGPLSYQTGYAPCFAALGGLSSLVGYADAAPSGMNIRYADSTFGAAAVCGALVALLHRRRSGVGQFVDVSAVEVMSSMIGDALMDFALNGAIAAADGNRHAEMAPHSVYPCSNDEWISIAVSSDAQWAALAQAMGKSELAAHASYASLGARKAREQQLDELIAAWTAQRDATALAQDLQQRGVPASKSQSSLDLVSDPLLWGREFYQQVSNSQGESKTTVGPSWKMSAAATISKAAPRLGEHNTYVLGDLLGLSAEEQRALAAARIAR